MTKNYDKLANHLINYFYLRQDLTNVRTALVR